MVTPLNTETGDGHQRPADPWDASPVLYSLQRALTDLGVVFLVSTVLFVPMVTTGMADRLLAWAELYPRLNLTELFLFAVMLTTGFSMAILRRWMQLTELVRRRERIEATLRRERAKLERSNAELERFAYIASHDLREPLRSIHAHLSLVERDASDQLSGGALESLDFAREGAARMDRMVKSLLTYARLEREDARSTQVDTETVLDEAIANLEVIADRADVQVETGSVPPVMADRDELLLLLQNLLQNAIKHSRRPGARVRVGGHARDGMARLWVEDEGPGVPEDQRDRIFELFRQGSAEARQEGAGIGLTVCKRIAERHDGRIWVEDAERGGARFVVELAAAT